MKKALTLLAVTMLTATSVGCNCCPCLRNICPWNLSGPAPVATYAAVPATCPPQPVYAAAPATPMYAAPQQYTVPQYAAPQYAMPAQPVYGDTGCGMPYAADSNCGVQYSVADPGCGYTDVGYGAPQQQIMVDPAPAP
jgi:hypothetical protein